MSSFENAQERDMILFVGSFLNTQVDAIKKISTMLGRNIRACVLIDITDPKAKEGIAKHNKAVYLECDFSSPLAIANTIKPYKDRFLAVTCRAEKNIPLFKKVIPHVPYLNTPTELSLDWTTDKIKMRQMLRNFDKTISPKFLVAHDSTKETLDRIEKQIGFPLILKPSGLAASLLVTICYYREELEDDMKNMVRKINQIYKKNKGRGEPQILVEEFMEGSMYSIDVYVNQRGVMYFAPMVHVRTGRAIGFDDFFNYMRTTPTQLRPHKIEAAKKAAEKAIEALNIRSLTCHIELMKTEDGWKIIELGPRIGGFRHEMYELSFGIDHTMNDILIRIPKKPILNKKLKGYTVALKFYARKKGRLINIVGINKVRKLDSFVNLKQYKQKGDMCDFARNGDNSVFDIVLFNKNRSKILADIRRIEKSVEIQVTGLKKK
jgi:biotin carboxylase